jgi:hypothetical protein
VIYFAGREFEDRLMIQKEAFVISKENKKAVHGSSVHMNIYLTKTYDIFTAVKRRVE